MDQKKFWGWLAGLRMTFYNFKEVMRSRLLEFSPPENFVTITSTGPAAECQGGSLGQFVRLSEGEYNGAPIYRQRDTMEVEGSVDLYRAQGGSGWCVARDLDAVGGIADLTNSHDSTSVPSDGWEYRVPQEMTHMDSYWTPTGLLPDYNVTITRGPLPVCQAVKLELGSALQAQSHRVGVYRPTGDWRDGHPVYEHSNGESRLLCASMFGGGWSILPSSDSVPTFESPFTLTTTWCPADSLDWRGIPLEAEDLSLQYFPLEEGDLSLQCDRQCHD